MKFLLLAIALLLAAKIHASPAEAALIQKEYQTVFEKYSLQLRIAATPEARETMKAPEAYPYAKRMWDAISPSLKEEWTLDPAVWFLRLSAGMLHEKPDGSTVPAFAEETQTLRAAIEAHHLASTKLSPLAIALVAGSDPRSLALLEKIEAKNPNPKVQGTAALAAAMVLKSLGDTPELMAKRLTLIRKAIIQSADVEIAGTTVAKLAEDELYIIRFLTKGRVAPDLKGTDTANRPLALSDHKGKIIVLLFWNSTLPDAARVISFAATLEEKLRDRPFVLIGVNNDPIEKLRALQADGTVRWPNFADPENKLAAEYRIGSRPLAYVLDGERKIQFAGPPGSFVELTAEALLPQK